MIGITSGILLESAKAKEGATSVIKKRIVCFKVKISIKTREIVLEFISVSFPKSDARRSAYLKL